MNKIQLFEEDQERQFKREQEINDRYNKQATTLTEDEKKRLEELKKKMNIDSSGKLLAMVNNEGGQVTEMTMSEYLRTVDENMSTLQDGTKLINASDDNVLGMARELVNGTIQAATRDQIRWKMVDYSLDPDNEISDEVVDGICARVSKICSELTGIPERNLKSEAVSEYLSKFTLQAYMEKFPMDVIDAFTTEEQRHDNPIECRQLLTDVFSLMIVEHNEVDDLNQYLNNTEKVVNVLIRLEACGKDLAEELRNPEKFSEIIAKTRLDTGEPTINPAVEKYINILKHPNMVADAYAVRYVTMMELANAYEKIKPEYEDPEEIAAVDREIEESHEKAARYLNVYHLTDFAEVYNAFAEASKTDKRISKSRMPALCKSYIDKIKKCKVNVSFPGYRPEMKTSNEIYLGYVKQIDAAIDNYNAKIQALTDEDREELKPITCDKETFANVLLCVMGRLVKKLSKNTADKFDSLELSSYFQRIGRMAHNEHDVCTLWDIYEVIHSMVEYIENK